MENWEHTEKYTNNQKHCPDIKDMRDSRINFVMYVFHSFSKHIYVCMCISVYVYICVHRNMC